MKAKRRSCYILDMSVFCKQLNPHACRTYMIGTDRIGFDKIGTQENGEIVLIDPVLEHFQDYTELLKQNGCKLTHVIDTHTHADHISAGAALKDYTGCVYMMHRNAPAKCVDFCVADGFEWELFGSISVKILYTPGHTGDSISLVFPDWIFTGDTLFLDDAGAGRDDLPGGDAGAHWESLQRLLELPENLTVYPAHEYRNRNPSSLGRQKRTNPHLAKKSKDEFIRYLDDLRLGPAEWMKDVLKANYACAKDPRAAWIPVDTPACEVKGTKDRGVNEAQVSSIPVQVLKQKLQSGGDPILLDVREEGELAGPLGHLEGITHIPIGSLAQRLGELEPYREREIVTVCRSGARAHTAAQILSTADFPRVSVMIGGMIAWNAQSD